jgi:tetratricopeptide (TPR) repeat protein
MAEELIPRMRQGIDLTKAGLSVEEGFIASRIDGRTTVKDIAIIVGKSKEETEKILNRLSRAGVIVLGQDVAPIEEEQESPSEEYGRFIFPPNLMMEEGDLDPETRKKIIWVHDHLEKWTFYELLQANRKADAKELKKAYFERSKEWHPDRFRKPNLGSFKRMLEAIFKKIQEAHSTLSDDETRTKYDEENVLMLDEDAISEMLAKQRKAEREEKRSQEAVERRKKKNPIRQRIAKAREFFEEAQRLKNEGQLLDALRAAQTAVAYDAKDEYKALEEEVRISAGQYKIGPFMRRGLHEESMTNWEDAISAFSEAVRFAPENGQAVLRLAYNLLMSSSRDPHEANVHAHKAVALLPDDPEAHFVLGLCYEKGGMEKAAIREYKAAVDMKPNYEDAKKRLKKLKWGF